MLYDTFDARRVVAVSSIFESESLWDREVYTTNNRYFDLHCILVCRKTFVMPWSVSHTLDNKIKNLLYWSENVTWPACLVPKMVLSFSASKTITSLLAPKMQVI